MDEAYKELNPELKMLLFSIEQSCGLKAGGGRVFNETTKRREVADVKHIFAFIAIGYLEYTHKQVREFLAIKYDSNINYGRKRVVGLIAYNRVYRNRIYTIAVDNGILPLVYDIIEATDNNRNRLKH